MNDGKKAKKVEKRRRRHGNETPADWGGASPELLASVVESVTKNGGAIRFGYSRDGGAYAIGIYGDGDPFTEYLGSTEDVDVWLESIRLDYE